MEKFLDFVTLYRDYLRERLISEAHTINKGKK